MLYLCPRRSLANLRPVAGRIEHVEHKAQFDFCRERFDSTESLVVKIALCIWNHCGASKQAVGLFCHRNYQIAGAEDIIYRHWTVVKFLLLSNVSKSARFIEVTGGCEPIRPVICEILACKRKAVRNA